MTSQVQSSVLQSKNYPQKALYMWSSVNIIGRTKTKKRASSNSLNLDSLNKHFQTIVVTLLHKSADTFAIPAISCDFNPFTFTEILKSLVLSYLNSLDIRKSTGPDGLCERDSCSPSYFILLFTVERHCTFRQEIL